MKIKNILYSSHFAKNFKKLDKYTKEQALAKEIIFRHDCFDERLKTHKLKGSLKDYWSFSITYSHRILFVFEENNDVSFIDVGDHSIYS